MKKLYRHHLIILSILLFGINKSYAQTAITTQLDSAARYFVQGLGTVSNQLSIWQLATAVDFEIQDATGNVLQTKPGANNNFTFSTTVNMSALPTGAAQIVAKYYDNGVPAGQSLPYTFKLISKPLWMQAPVNGGIVPFYTTVNYNSSQINTICVMPTMATLEGIIGSSIKGIGGKDLGGNGSLVFGASFDMKTGNTSVTTPGKFFLSLNVLKRDFFFQNSSGSYASSVALSVDSNFNVIMNGLLTWQETAFKKDVPISKIPIIGPVCLYTDLHLSVIPKIQSRLVVGVQGNTWGFIQDPATQEKTAVRAKLETKARIKGEIRAVCGTQLIPPIAKASITGTLNLGAHSTFSLADGLTKSFGLDFSVDGSVSVVGGIWKKSGNLYGPVSAGDNTVFSFKNNPDDFVSASTTRAAGSGMPTAWTNQVMSARDSALAIAWIDDVNYGSNTALSLTWYNPINNAFTPAVNVQLNDKLLQTPSVTLLPNHNALITWVETSTPKSQLDVNTQTIDQIMGTQNIWYAELENGTGAIISKQQINSSVDVEAAPQIVWSSGNQGLLVWEAGDAVNLGNDLMYSVINGSTPSAPQMLSAGSMGFNTNLQVAHLGSNQAIASWISDADMDDSTNNSVLMYSIWNGSSWSAPAQRTTLPLNVRLKDLTMATNGSYGTEVVSYDYTSETDSMVYNGIYLGTWTNSDPAGTSYQHTFYEDSIYSIHKPKVSISKNGLATLSIHTTNDVELDDDGQSNLYINDLANGGNWTNLKSTYPQYLPYLIDSNNFVWDLATAHGYLSTQPSSDIIYSLTQEIDATETTNPGNGVVFGNPNLNLVLRTLKLNVTNNVLSMDTTVEPVVSDLYNGIETLNGFSDYASLLQNFPNPAGGSTIIPFHLNKEAQVILELFDIDGRSMGVLLEGRMDAANYKTEVNTANLSNGVYYYKLSVNSKSQTKKMVIMK